MREWIDYDAALAHVARFEGEKARAELHRAIAREEVGARADKWNIDGSTIRLGQPDHTFWQYAVSTANQQNCLEVPEQFTDDQGHIAEYPAKASGVHVRSSDLFRIWPMPQPQDAREPRNGRKGVGGAKSRVDWERYLIEAAAYIYAKGPPPKQTELFEHLWTTFGDKEGGAGLTQMKKHIGPLYHRLAKIEND